MEDPVNDCNFQWYHFECPFEAVSRSLRLKSARPSKQVNFFIFSIFWNVSANFSHPITARRNFHNYKKSLSWEKVALKYNLWTFFLFLTIRWGNRVYFFGKQKIKTIVFLFILNNLLQQTLVFKSLKDYFLYFVTS